MGHKFYKLCIWVFIMYVKKYIPNMLTLLNAGSGMVAILFIFQLKFNLGVLFIFLSIVFDYLDGNVARMLGVDSKLGIQLDSLSDVISFGVAPALLLIVKFEFNLLIIVGGILYVMAGVYRLAEYNVGVRKLKNGFLGVPITFGGLILILVSYLSNVYLVGLLTIVCAYGLISKIKVRKL